MGKYGVNGHPPEVAVSGQVEEKKVNGSPIVGADGKPFNREVVDIVVDPRLNCIGQFSIPLAHIRQRYDDVARLMSDIVVLHTEVVEVPNFGHVYTYIGISQKYFAPIAPNAKVPLYDIAMRLDGLFEVTVVPTMEAVHE